MSSARSGVCRNATRRRPSGRCRLRARVGRARRWRRDAARPRERRRRPYGVVIDLIHVAEYVCKAVPVFHRHRRHRRGVRYLVRDRMEFTGARRCYTAPLFHPCAGPDPPGGQLGWSRGGSEAPGATKPAATSMRTGTSTTREYQRHHAQRYADGIARPVSKPPPAALPTTPSTGQVALAVPLAEAPWAADEEEPHPSRSAPGRRSGLPRGIPAASLKLRHAERHVVGEPRLPRGIPAASLKRVRFVPSHGGFPASSAGNTRGLIEALRCETRHPPSLAVFRGEYPRPH